MSAVLPFGFVGFDLKEHPVSGIQWPVAASCQLPVAVAVAVARGLQWPSGY
jgi:hypothetical protein